MSPGELAELMRLLTDPEAIDAALPVAEREEYRRCQESVVEARRLAPILEGWRVVY